MPVRFSRELTAAINQAGGQAKHTEYPGVGHDRWMKASEEPELWAWLFAQKREMGGSVVGQTSVFAEWGNAGALPSVLTMPEIEFKASR